MRRSGSRNAVQEPEPSVETGDCRPKTVDRSSASALAAVAALALPAMLSLPLPLGMAWPAAPTAVAVTVWLTGSRSGPTLPLASKARGLSRRRPLRARRSPASAARRAMPVPVALEPSATAPAARLTNGEVGIFPVRRLPLGARQRRTNQTTVHRAVLVGRGGRDRFLFGGFVAAKRFDRFERDGFGCGEFRGRWSLDELVARYDVVRCCLEVLNRQGRASARLWRPGAHLRDEDARFLLAPRRYPRLLVFMVRIAGGAARLLDLVLDHRDHRVVGDAALTRTIVVQNVTEPKPALLH